MGEVDGCRSRVGPAGSTSFSNGSASTVRTALVDIKTATVFEANWVLIAHKILWAAYLMLQIPCP